MVDALIDFIDKECANSYSVLVIHAFGSFFVTGFVCFNIQNNIDSFRIDMSILPVPNAFLSMSVHSSSL